MGCVNDVFFPRAALAAARVLEHLGVEVDVPQAQTCCGQAHYNSGYPHQARRLARHFLHAFGRADCIVGVSPSCTAMVREGYGPLLRASPLLAERAEEVAGRVYEFSEFIVRRLGQVQLGARFSARAVYHTSCHALRLLHLAEPPLRLLQAVEGLELLALPDAERCCGFGGTFSVKSPEVSVAMADDKLDGILATGAELVVSGDTSCLLHLMGRAHRRQLGLRFAHLAEVLAEGLGLMRHGRGVPLAPQAEMPAGRSRNGDRGGRPAAEGEAPWQP